MKQKIDYLRRYQDVVRFLTVRRILDVYPTFDSYRLASNSDRAYKLGCAVKASLRRKLVRIGTGKDEKWMAEEFDKASENLFVFHRHVHKNFKSGKHYVRNAWYEAALSEVEWAFGHESEWNTGNTEKFCREAHVWIDSKVYRFDKKDKKQENSEEDMTKAEKVQLKKECDEGKHAMPYEKLVKDREKFERQAKNRQERRIKRLTEKAMVEETVERERLRAENEALKAELERQKALKDQNSDIPEERQPETSAEERQPADSPAFLTTVAFGGMTYGISEPAPAGIVPRMPVAPDEDVPTAAEELASRRQKYLWFRLQDAHDRGWLQFNEAEMLRKACMFAEEIPPIVDRGMCLMDVCRHKLERAKFIYWVRKHAEDLTVDVDGDNKLHEWLSNSWAMVNRWQKDGAIPA